MSEKQFQAAVVELAERTGWRCFHASDSRKAVRRGDQTILIPDGAASGFPDLVLCHPGRRRVIFAELKKSKGKLRPGQKPWLDDLAHAGADVYLWRPEHWPAIEAVLTGRAS